MVPRNIFVAVKTLLTRDNLKKRWSEWFYLSQASTVCKKLLWSVMRLRPSGGRSISTANHFFPYSESVHQVDGSNLNIRPSSRWTSRRMDGPRTAVRVRGGLTYTEKMKRLGGKSSKEKVSYVNFKWVRTQRNHKRSIQTPS